MPIPTLLVATWGGGLFTVAGDAVHHQFAGQTIASMVADGRGGLFAIVGGHSLRRRSPAGEWHVIAESESPLSCCVPLGDNIFVGTDDAQILRVDPDGTPHRLAGFDTVPGRDRWYAGAAMIDGVLMGPPLGIRSMAATADGAVLLANVHVGGIPRSTDGGRTWQPTIEIDSDVHQVRAHPTRPDIVAAAAAAGLCISRDAGATWTIEQDGLHASYCSAVAFSGDEILVAASTDHFAREGAVYRRQLDGEGPLERLAGIPQWIEGIVDTGCIAAQDGTIIVIDRSGNIHMIRDDKLVRSHALGRDVVPNGLFLP